MLEYRGLFFLILLISIWVILDCFLLALIAYFIYLFGWKEERSPKLATFEQIKANDKSNY